MNHQELLQDLTESYLKSLISDVSGSLSSDFDSCAPFGELGIDSFYVLKIIRKLESDFGTLPKSLLFENFNVTDLANYFVRKHEQTLSAKFADQLGETNSRRHTNGRHPKPAEVSEEAKPPAANQAKIIARETGPIRMLEADLCSHPDLQELIHQIYDHHMIEGCVSLGTRKIAPNLFIGSARR